MRNPLTTWRNKCDRALQQKVANEYKYCLICGNPVQVGHHFFPKSVSSRLRYEWENIIPLCSGCHMRLHQSGDPRYEQRIIAVKGERWYESLERIARDYQKVNVAYYKQMYERLTSSLK